MTSRPRFSVVQSPKYDQDVRDLGGVAHLEPVLKGLLWALQKNPKEAGAPLGFGLYTAKLFSSPPIFVWYQVVDERVSLLRARTDLGPYGTTQPPQQSTSLAGEPNPG